MLYLVGTPIGNLSDLSPRAKDTLNEVDLIACEDTRRSGLLLAAFGIKKPLISYHEHNRSSRGQLLLRHLLEGKNIALVSDAGMPCISDPGSDLVNLCVDNNIPVEVIPGPVAAIAALVLSGLDSRRFLFEGFLPPDGRERKERIAQLAENRCTSILYEAPHRIVRTLGDLAKAGLNDRRVAICRELTKRYEEVLRMSVAEALLHFSEQPPRGEFVLVIDACTSNISSERMEIPEESKAERVSQLQENGLPTKEMAGILAKEWGITKKEAYSFIIKMIN